MPKNKTKFNKNWLTTYPWISEVNNDIHKAHCKLCKCTIKIGVGGVGAVNVHQNTAKHKTLRSKAARNGPLNKCFSTGINDFQPHSEKNLDMTLEIVKCFEND